MVRDNLKRREHYVIVATLFIVKYKAKYRRKYNIRVFRICRSMKDTQHNGQAKKYKSTKNDLQNIHIKLKIE